MISWPNSRECSVSIPDITLHMLHASPHIGLTCSYGFQSYTFHCQAEKSFSRIEDSEYSTGEISSGCVDMRWTILGSHVHARSWHLSHITYCRWCDLWQMKYCDVMGKPQQIDIVQVGTFTELRSWDHSCSFSYDGPSSVMLFVHIKASLVELHMFNRSWIVSSSIIVGFYPSLCMWCIHKNSINTVHWKEIPAHEAVQNLWVWIFFFFLMQKTQHFHYVRHSA